MLADTEGLDLDDAARIVGCWNGLAKRGVDGGRLDEVDAAPMHRAVAFARNIKESKQLALQFEQVSRQLATSTDPMTPDLRVEASHVDGTFPMAQRVRELEQENRELRRANEVLKRAASFFGAELDRQHKK